MPKRRIRIDLTDKPFGELVAKYCVGRDRWGAALWYCECSCGGNKIIIGASLRDGKTTTCGNPAHWSGENSATYKHGQARVGRYTVEYRTWCGMKNRCSNEKDEFYEYYGGRGITVCERWLNSFENFFADMGPKPEPQKQYSIDRINNDLGYGPDNCRWATWKEQAQNRSNNVN